VAPGSITARQKSSDIAAGFAGGGGTRKRAGRPDRGLPRSGPGVMAP
jgi:hypothetical protein